MKKKMMFIIIFFIGLFISVNKVDAIDCVYGTKNRDDGKDWSKQIVIKDVTGWEVGSGYNVIFMESPMISSIYNNTNLVTKSGVTYYESRIDNTYPDPNDNLQFFISLYPNNTVYTNLKGACPPKLKYRYYSKMSAFDLYDVYVLYNDELDEKDPKNSFFQKVFTSFGDLFASDVKEEGILVEENSKDIPISELIDEYDCITYSSSIQAMKQAVKDGDCDASPEFKRLYTNLRDVCDSFNATASYVKEDGSGEFKAKACARACSNLKDDVAKICKVEIGENCGSLGYKILKWIFKIVRYVRYIVPIVVILLTALDYMKALASDDDKAMKDATSHMFKRLLIAALIFVIPFILDFILSIFNIPGLNTDNPFCAK